MADQIFKTRIKNKYDTEANWSKATFVPLKGELIIYAPDEVHPYERFKIGNGITPINELKFSNGVGSYISSIGAEIFNDYENNTTNIPYSHVEGKRNSSIIKTFLITAFTENTVTLDSVEGIEADMMWNIFVPSEDGVYRYSGKTVSVDGSTVTLVSGTEPDKNTPLANLLPGASDVTLAPATEGKFYSTFIVNGGYIGSTIIQDNEANFSSHIEGRNNFTSLDAHAEGNSTKALGYASHTEGRLSNAIGEVSHAEGYNTKAGGISSHAEGGSTKSLGHYSHSEGGNTEAQGKCSHAEGGLTKAIGISSHAEGDETTANGSGSHTEGYKTKTDAAYAHAEGKSTISSGEGAHAEGGGSQATANYAHAEGAVAIASGIASHSEGGDTKATEIYAHAEGYGSQANGTGSHAEGNLTTASGAYSHTEGQKTTTSANNAHAEGQSSTASGVAAHAEGSGTVASNEGAHAEGGSSQAISKFAHAEGAVTKAEGQASHAEGGSTVASGLYSHAEGNTTEATKTSAHSEGNKTHATGNYSHAEGNSTTASGEASHAEGASTSATNKRAHAEGSGTIASGMNSHAEGGGTTASGGNSHAEGQSTVAKNSYAHSEGYGTIAAGLASHAEGKFNIEDTSNKYAHIVGNGESDSVRSNAYTLDWSGNGRYAGKVYSEGSKELVTKEYATSLLNETKEYVDEKMSSIKPISYTGVSSGTIDVNVSSTRTEIVNANNKASIDIPIRSNDTKCKINNTTSGTIAAIWLYHDEMDNDVTILSNNLSNEIDFREYGPVYKIMVGFSIQTGHNETLEVIITSTDSTISAELNNETKTILDTTKNILGIKNSSTYELTEAGITIPIDNTATKYILTFDKIPNPINPIELYTTDGQSIVAGVGTTKQTVIALSEYNSEIESILIFDYGQINSVTITKLVDSVGLTSADIAHGNRNLLDIITSLENRIAELEAHIS